jgi:hypothetical protein
MGLGFETADDFKPIVGWELYQVTFDKFHVMFWFQDGRGLLNIADRFSYRSSDSDVVYTYEIYGPAKFANLDRILRVAIERVNVVSVRQLDLIFTNGDVLSVHDNPKFRSWWFFLNAPSSAPPAPGPEVLWAMDDDDPFEDRAVVLGALLNLSAPLGRVEKLLKGHPWDSDDDVVILERHHLRSILSRYASGKLDAKIVEMWANAIEGREDIGFPAGDGLVRDILNELANSTLTEELSAARAKVLLKRLGGQL